MSVSKRILNTYSQICGQKLKLERKPLLNRFNSIGILHRQFIHLVSFLVLVSAQSLGLFVCILNSQEDCKSHCVPRKARKEIKATIPVLDFERYFSIAFSPASSTSISSVFLLIQFESLEF